MGDFSILKLEELKHSRIKVHLSTRQSEGYYPISKGGEIMTPLVLKVS